MFVMVIERVFANNRKRSAVRIIPKGGCFVLLGLACGCLANSDNPIPSHIQQRKCILPLCSSCDDSAGVLAGGGVLLLLHVCMMDNRVARSN